MYIKQQQNCTSCVCACNCCNFRLRSRMQAGSCMSCLLLSERARERERERERESEVQSINKVNQTTARTEKKESEGRGEKKNPVLFPCVLLVFNLSSIIPDAKFHSSLATSCILGHFTAKYPHFHSAHFLRDIFTPWYWHRKLHLSS